MDSDYNSGIWTKKALLKSALDHRRQENVTKSSYRCLGTLLREDLVLAVNVWEADRTNDAKWEVYEKAAKHFYDFVLDRKIPDDLAVKTAESRRSRIDRTLNQACDWQTGSAETKL